MKSAVDELVNQLIFLSEDVADAQLLAVLGTRTGGVPRPEALDAHRSENGLADLLDNLAGIQNVYFGSYAGRQGDELAAPSSRRSVPRSPACLALAIHRCAGDRDAHPATARGGGDDRPALVERAQVRAKELMARLEIDLVSALGSDAALQPERRRLRKDQGSRVRGFTEQCGSENERARCSRRSTSRRWWRSASPSAR